MGVHFFIPMLLLPLTSSLIYLKLKKIKGPKMDSLFHFHFTFTSLPQLTLVESYTPYLRYRRLTFVESYPPYLLHTSFISPPYPLHIPSIYPPFPPSLLHLS